jgi:hypothetical protein
MTRPNINLIGCFCCGGGGGPDGIVCNSACKGSTVPDPMMSDADNGCCCNCHWPDTATVTVTGTGPCNSDGTYAMFRSGFCDYLSVEQLDGVPFVSAAFGGDPGTGCSLDIVVQINNGMGGVIDWGCTFDSVPCHGVICCTDEPTFIPNCGATVTPTLCFDLGAGVGVRTFCCCPVPETLTVTFSYNVGFTPDCLDGATATLTYDPSTQTWSGVASTCAGSLSIALVCTGDLPGFWNFSIGTLLDTVSCMLCQCSCNPFKLVYLGCLSRPGLIITIQ